MLTPVPHVARLDPIPNHNQHAECSQRQLARWPAVLAPWLPMTMLEALVCLGGAALVLEHPGPH